MQTIFRSNRNRAYTKLNNEFLQNKELSWEARGMLADILSRPPDWNISFSGLVSMSKAGKDRVRRIVNDLIAAGYMRRIAERDTQGKFVAWVYIASDDPLEIKDINDSTPLPENPEMGENPLPENPELANPLPENPPQQRKDFNKGISEQKKAKNFSGKKAISESPQLEPLREALNGNAAMLEGARLTKAGVLLLSSFEAVNAVARFLARNRELGRSSGIREIKRK